MSDLNPDYSKRDCSLPAGCKDLIDVLNLNKRRNLADPPVKIVPLPTKSGEGFTVEITPATTVKDLAEILHLRPIEIIAGLMGMGVFANLNHVVDFDSAAKLLAKYGYFATKPA